MDKLAIRTKLNQLHKQYHLPLEPIVVFVNMGSKIGKVIPIHNGYAFNVKKIFTYTDYLQTQIVLHELAHTIAWHIGKENYLSPHDEDFQEICRCIGCIITGPKLFS